MMLDRKEHVLKHAHQLFIKKGFRDTSIQDILEESNISKGTFYNYFSSKNELLISIFEASYERLERMRNALLEKSSHENMETFLEQLTLQFEWNKENKLFLLFEEVSLSKNHDLMQCVKSIQLRDMAWYNQRLIHLFGEENRPILLDCTVMFRGILYQNIKYHSLVQDTNLNIHKVVQYCLNRLKNMVEHLSKTREQLLDPNLLLKWLQEDNQGSTQTKSIIVNTAHQIVMNLSKYTTTNQKTEELSELLQFIIEEFSSDKKIRMYMIASAITSLKQYNQLDWNQEILKLEEMIQLYREEDGTKVFSKKENPNFD